MHPRRPGHRRCRARQRRRHVAEWFIETFSFLGGDPRDVASSRTLQIASSACHHTCTLSYSALSVGNSACDAIISSLAFRGGSTLAISNPHTNDPSFCSREPTAGRTRHLGCPTPKNLNVAPSSKICFMQQAKSRSRSSDFRDFILFPRYASIDHFPDYFEEFILALILLAAVPLGRLPIQMVRYGQPLPTQTCSGALYRAPEPESHAISACQCDTVCRFQR